MLPLRDNRTREMNSELTEECKVSSDLPSNSHQLKSTVIETQ
jgi:hypothetical protein